MIDTEELIDFVYDNLLKILGIVITALLKDFLISPIKLFIGKFFSIFVKVIDLVKFEIKIQQTKEYREFLEKLNNICYNTRYILEADRVTYLRIHNGEITGANVHLAKISALVESHDENIKSYINETQNKVITNFAQYTKYFLEHKIIICNDIDNFEEPEIQEEFERRDIKSFFVMMISRKDIPIGFLRVEYCYKKNHTPDFIEKAINLLEIKEKKIWRILK